MKTNPRTLIQQYSVHLGGFYDIFHSVGIKCFVVSDFPSFLVSRSKLWGTGTPVLAWGSIIMSVRYSIRGKDWSRLTLMQFFVVIISFFRIMKMYLSLGSRLECCHLKNSTWCVRAGQRHFCHEGRHTRAWGCWRRCFLFLMFWKFPDENSQGKTLSFSLKPNSKHVLCTSVFFFFSPKGWRKELPLELRFFSGFKWKIPSLWLLNL